ncbi:hypothetical protein CHARACLAT_022096, partial [Characodon lateralis]|nr:hypothetical protein [Characodon lateralis]
MDTKGDKNKHLHSNGCCGLPTVEDWERRKHLKSTRDRGSEIWQQPAAAASKGLDTELLSLLMMQHHIRCRDGSSDHLGTLGGHEELCQKESLDCEDPREYCYGGYHRVQIGDTFNRRYQVVSKLGWGFFSTVWLCMDLRSGRRVAVKVLKSGAGFTQAGQDEQALLRYSSGPVSRHPSSQRIVKLLDEFKLAGVNGVHMCLVLELLGPNLRSWQLCFGKPGLLQPWVKQILTQVLQGLDYLHSQCKIIHTDIKPENILFYLQEQTNIAPAGGSSSLALPAGKKTDTTEQANPYQLEEISVKIADLGSSCWVVSISVFPYTCSLQVCSMFQTALCCTLK